MEVIELRAEHPADREALKQYLAAHLALERATARRALLAHLTALAGIPVWTCLLVPVSHGWRVFAVWAFAAALAALVAALASESSYRAGVRDAERQAPVRRVESE
jgi:hypothetical protein